MAEYEACHIVLPVIVPCLEPKRCLIWILNSESSNSIKPFHSLFPYQNLCLHSAYCEWIRHLWGVTSWVTQLLILIVSTTTIYLGCYSTNFLCQDMQNSTTKIGHCRGTCNKEGNKAGDIKLQRKIKWKKHLKLGQLVNDSDPLSFAKTHEQFGIMCIPDVLWINCNFEGQVVHDTRTTSEEWLSITSIYPVKLHLASLRGKRTNIYEYLAAVQRTKFAVVPMHTTQEF